MAEGRERNILYVDDEEGNLVVFKNTFWEDFEVFTAKSAEEGLKLLEDNDIPLIISDQRMPGMTGVEFLEIVKEKYPRSVRMVLTGYTDVHDIIESINRGNVYKFVTKPWEKDDLFVDFIRAFDAYELELENERLTENLIVSEKMATVGQLASGISHEIKNQLSALSFAELIQDKYKDDERLMKYSQMIVDAKNRLLALVSEIRDFAKGQSQTFTMGSHDLSALIEEVTSFMRFDGDLKRKNITRELDDSIKIQADKDRIKQVIINLLKNAAQANNSDGAEILLKTSIEDGKNVVISIRDAGTGIPDESAERIWEPFYTTKEDIGTGLGLDICKQIVEKHGGTISFSNNTPDPGVTFEIRIPVKNS